MIIIAFKALFLAHAPDGDAEKHRCAIETPKFYKLFVIVVNNQEQAIEMSQKFVKEEGVQSILLCPGFTYKDIAEIKEAVGEKIGIFVARGDGPSNRISMEVMIREGFLPEKGRE